MDPIAINRTIIDFKQFKEIYEAVFPTHLQKRVTYFGFIIFVFGLAAVLILKIKKMPISFGITFPIAGLFIFGMGVRLPKSEAKKKFNAMCQVLHCDDVISRELAFYEDCFEVKNKNGEVSTFQYEEILSLISTQNYKIIEFEGHKYVFIDPKGFYLGSLQDIERYIDPKFCL